ncbi:MAG: hypothetical protein Q4A07_13365 [Coriobacteriales bacterium]|nr:hypothetical protein [Coriobacteriales bacterium]
MLVDDELNTPSSTSDTTGNGHGLTDEQSRQLAKAIEVALNSLLNKEDNLYVGVVTQDDDTQSGVSNEMRQRIKRALVTFFQDLASEEYGADASDLVFALLPFLTSSIGIDLQGTKANTTLVDLLGRITNSLMKNDEETYASFADAADGFFTAGINAVTPALVEGARTTYDNSYAEELGEYLATLAGSPTQARNILVGMLFGTKGYDTTYAIATLSTLVRSVGAVVVGHTCETYLAWMRAVRKATNEGPHTIYQLVLSGV